MKRKRGLRRYYKNLETQTESWTELNFSNSEKAWFDLWHMHFDTEGFGNKSFKRRKPHLEKLIRHFDLLGNKALQLKTDFQIWAILYDFSSYNDALYLHTPVLGNDNFPVQIEGLTQECTLKNKALKDFLVGLSGFILRYGKADEGFCVIYKSEYGISL